MKSFLFIIYMSTVFFSIGNVEPSFGKIEIEKTLGEKEQAFKILQTKCNVCHEKKNKRRVFTLDNMDGYGKKIYKQVFKWKRMPKGNEIKLTSEEYTQLKEWLFTLNQK